MLLAEVVCYVAGTGHSYLSQWKRVLQVNYSYITGRGCCGDIRLLVIYSVVHIIFIIIVIYYCCICKSIS